MCSLFKPLLYGGQNGRWWQLQLSIAVTHLSCFVICEFLTLKVLSKLLLWSDCFGQIFFGQKFTSLSRNFGKFGQRFCCSVIGLVIGLEIEHWANLWSRKIHMNRYFSCYLVLSLLVGRESPILKWRLCLNGRSLYR